MIFQKIRELAPYGIRHEFAKRYTPMDWYKSRKVSRSIDAVNADLFIGNLIENGLSGLVGRLGGTEARFLGEYSKLKSLSRFGVPLSVSSKISRRWKKRKVEIFNNAGFYSDSWLEIDRFYAEYVAALTNTDILGAWGVAFTWVESLALKSKEIEVIPVGYTAPWVERYVESETAEPWSQALDGKKVLVVSGFADSIKAQHVKYPNIYKGIKYPKFDLLTVKAPITSGQTSALGKSWFMLLDEMKTIIDGLDFDIALIAAGAYSYPLANHVKNMGKIGIHCGGGLQIFFGIMGNRWNNSPEILKYVNESWTRPSKNETPPRADLIEGACYW
jgi:hypothetical protein